MSWADAHARFDILNDVLDRAALDPSGAVTDTFSTHPEAARLFGDPEGILAALRARWANHLNTKLDFAIESGIDPMWAWQQLAAEQPQLRAVLDHAAGRTLVPAA